MSDAFARWVAQSVLEMSGFDGRASASDARKYALTTAKTGADACQVAAADISWAQNRVSALLFAVAPTNKRNRFRK